MTLIIDASAAVGMEFNDAKGARIRELVAGAEWLVVPELYVAEVTNVMWKYHRAGLVHEERLERTLDDLLDLPDAIEPTREMAREVFGTAARLGHSAYDLFYLVLARRMNGRLLTLDQRLVALCDTTGVKRAL